MSFDVNKGKCLGTDAAMCEDLAGLPEEEDSTNDAIYEDGEWSASWAWHEELQASGHTPYDEDDYGSDFYDDLGNYIPDLLLEEDIARAGG